MNPEYLCDHIDGLYWTYAKEIMETQNKLSLVYNNMIPQTNDMECEINYLLIRSSKPKTIVEFSPYRGWSSSWLLSAAEDNKYGNIYSVGPKDACVQEIPVHLRNRFNFFKGSPREILTKNINLEEVDFMLIDSDHTKEYAMWYIENVLPKLRNCIVAIHDIFWLNTTKEPDRLSLQNETGCLLNYLKGNYLDYYTVAPVQNGVDYKILNDTRRKIGLKNLHHETHNPMLYYWVY